MIFQQPCSNALEPLTLSERPVKLVVLGRCYFRRRYNRLVVRPVPILTNAIDIL